mgnify:CR=1 FL=1
MGWYLVSHVGYTTTSESWIGEVLKCFGIVTEPNCNKENVKSNGNINKSDFIFLLLLFLLYSSFD